MLKRYEIPFLIFCIFFLVLVLRFLFHFSVESEFKIGSNVEFEHTFLELPRSNDFQQYFYKDNVLVTLPLFPEYSYGDRLRLKGTVESYSSKTEDVLIEKLIIKNPEVKILESGELAVFKFIRQKVLLTYKSVLPPRETGLLSGIVLGVEDGINSEFKNELKRSGMLHVVVASGSNIVLVAGILFGIINSMLSKRSAVLLTVLGIFFYAFLTGFDPPIVRASIMASFGFTAMLLGRQGVALISLFFSAWIMLIISPNLISDIGFQLSFSATFGIILFQKIITIILKFIPKFIEEDFATTLSAQIGAMPFLLIAFGEMNLLSIFINIVLLWTVPVIMILGLIGAVLGLISPVIAAPVIYLTYPFLAFFSEVVRHSSHFYVPLSISGIFTPIAIIYYILLVYILVKLRIKPPKAGIKN